MTSVMRTVALVSVLFAWLLALAVFIATLRRGQTRFRRLFPLGLLLGMTSLLVDMVPQRFAWAHKHVMITDGIGLSLGVIGFIIVIASVRRHRTAAGPGRPAHKP